MQPVKGRTTERKYAQVLKRVLSALFIFHLLVLFTFFTSCDKRPFETPEPPSFDWKASIYQNPVPIAQVQEPDCDIMPPLNGPEPPFDGYAYYHTSPDPVVWKIKLNKSRRDMIAYISYVPDLEADQQEYAGYFTLYIKDLISGEVTLVDEMWQGYHLGFDFAGDYLIYEKNFSGVLYNWKDDSRKEIGSSIDYPSLSPDGSKMSYDFPDSDGRDQKCIQDIASQKFLYLSRNDSFVGNVVWISAYEAIATDLETNLNEIDFRNIDRINHFSGPFDWGLGFLVGFSQDGNYVYGNSYGVSDLNTLKVNRLWKTALPENCGNRDLGNFFILPDNTFMMRKTYYISDHEKRTVHPEYHWHLFDADGSNERRVDLQL